MIFKISCCYNIINKALYYHKDLDFFLKKYQPFSNAPNPWQPWSKKLFCLLHLNSIRSNLQLPTLDFLSSGSSSHSAFSCAQSLDWCSFCWSLQQQFWQTKQLLCTARCSLWHPHLEKGLTQMFPTPVNWLPNAGQLPWT